MKFNIHPLEDQSRLDEVCALFARGLGETTADFWMWKHFSENGLPEGLMLIAEDEAGTIQGMYALQPEWYNCDGRDALFVQTEDLVIAPEARGTGLMKQIQDYMVDYYAKMGAVGWIAFANEVSYPIFLKYGAQNMGDIFTRTTKRKVVSPGKAKTVIQKGNWTIAFADHMPQDLFFSEGVGTYRMKKNPAFMKWKFDDNPEQSFRWLLLREHGRLKGYLVFHVNQGRLRRAVNIYDADIRPDVPEDVLRVAVKQLQKLGHWVSLWGRFSPEEETMWTRAGLDQTSDQGTHFLIGAFPGQTLPDHWRVTRADLDF